MSERTTPLDAVDQLHQIKDELRVIWLALGNAENAEGYLTEIGEHVNGLANRLDDICQQMTGGAG